MRALTLTEDHVRRATRVVPESPEGTPGFTPLDEAGIAARAGRILASRPPGPLRVFAYGSLIWNPTFDPAARMRAEAHGWHRQFSMEITGFRGTPEAPGLMMALMPGGRCAGVVLEAPEAEAETVATGLVRRELPIVEAEADWRWITAATAEGPQRALVFWAGPRGAFVRRGQPPEAVARQIARACGWRGSGAEYLRNTVAALEAHGIHDRSLWRLQHLVAAEIDRLWPG